MRILKILSTVTGIGALLMSALLVFAGGAVLTVTSNSGYTDLPTMQLAGPGVGVVEKVDFSFDVRDDDVTFTPPDVRFLGRLDSTKDIFVGVGPDARVNAYLSESGFIHSVGRRGEIRLALGDGEVFADPAEQDFWLATSTGDSIDWTLPAGDYAFVVLNRDGSAGLDVAFDGSVRIPFVRPFGGILLATGAAAALVGLVLVYVGVRRQDPPAAPTPSPAVAAT